MRSYLNVEDEQIRILLNMFMEISLSRSLAKSEEYLQMVLKEALLKSIHEW